MSYGEDHNSYCLNNSSNTFRLNEVHSVVLGDKHVNRCRASPHGLTLLRTWRTKKTNTHGLTREHT